MTSIGCRAGHPVRGPSLEESMELGSWAPLEQLERAAKRRLVRAGQSSRTPRQPSGTPRQSSGAPVRWEGRSPMVSPPVVSARLQAHMLFGRTHATRPEQPSPRTPSQAARGHSMRCGRSWTPIMQRHQHLDSWEPAARTSTTHMSKLSDISGRLHQKPVGDINTRRLNAHAALLRNLVKESKARSEPPPDPREEARRRLRRREMRADAARWDMRSPDQATLEQQEAAAMNGSAAILDERELAASWAANETNKSSSTGWSQGFAASARGRSNIYAHRNAARSRSLTDRSGERRTGAALACRAPRPLDELLSWPPHSGTPRPPDRAATTSPATRAEAEALRQLLLGNADAV